MLGANALAFSKLTIDSKPVSLSMHFILNLVDLRVLLLYMLPSTLMAINEMRADVLLSRMSAFFKVWVLSACILLYRLLKFQILSNDVAGSSSFRLGSVDGQPINRSPFFLHRRRPKKGRSRGASQQQGIYSRDFERSIHCL